MTRWKWALLIFELALFALILILPQVDLPDFTFHNDTAPVAAKARLASPPARVALGTVAVTSSFPAPIEEIRLESSGGAAPVSSDARLSLLCTLLC